MSSTKTTLKNNKSQANVNQKGNPERKQKVNPIRNKEGNPERSRRVPQLRFKEFDGEWEKKKLGDITHRIGDGLHGTPIYVENSDISFINGNNLKDGIIVINEKTKKVNENTFLKNNKNLSKNTLLISLNGTIGNIARFNNEKIMLGKSVGYFNFNEESNYYYHVLTSPKVQRFFVSELTGSTIKNLSLKTLRETVVNLPTLPEQEKIATFLSAVDEKIQQLTKKKELLAQYKKGVMQQLFSGELRFKPELSGAEEDDTSTPLSAKNGNNYPDWEWVGGNVLFDNISDKNHNSDLPILAITQDQGAIPRDLINYKMSVTEKSVASYKVVQIGDFVISLRTFQGGIEFSSYHGICSPAYIILRPNSNDVCSAFYKFYLKTSMYIKQLQKNLEGIRDGKMISYKYFSEIKIPFPSLPEQQKIANYLSALDTKIETVNKQITQTQAFKKGLLQQMFV